LGTKTPSKLDNPFARYAHRARGRAVSAPTENRPDACVVSILDWLRNKRSTAQHNKLEQLVNLLNEIVAEGVLPAL
jgi:hypothetical protein